MTPLAPSVTVLREIQERCPAVRLELHTERRTGATRPDAGDA